MREVMTGINKKIRILVTISPSNDDSLQLYSNTTSAKKNCNKSQLLLLYKVLIMNFMSFSPNESIFLSDFSLLPDDWLSIVMISQFYSKASYKFIFISYGVGILNVCFMTCIMINSPDITKAKPILPLYFFYKFDSIESSPS